MMIEYLLKNLTCVTSVDPNAIVSHRSSKKHYKSFSGCQLVMRGLIKALFVNNTRVKAHTA